ncbi:MAG TPA: hypothetical protein VK826_12095, partial [Bacteroidia bacterium]|nr:hypothetical protein [Bacteroidia bacterium]
MEIREKIKSGRFYHICTRSNGTDLLFRATHDYNYFMDKCRKKLSDAWELIAWVMIPNEVHLVIRIKDDPETNPDLDHANLFGHVLNGYV